MMFGYAHSCSSHMTLRRATAQVTIRNDEPRLAVDGSYVDAHDGKIVAGGSITGLFTAHGQDLLHCIWDDT